MWLINGLIGISRDDRQRNGLWGYLTSRVERRKAIDLERERNRATAKALKLLREGDEMLEYEREGRLRVIRISASARRLPRTGPDDGARQ